VATYKETNPLDAGPVRRAVTAAGGPALPPRDWFDDPKLEGPTPLTVTSDGRVYGHLAAWGTQHIGMPGRVTPPHSATDYAYFKTGVIACADGSEVPVGQLTLSGGHAPLSADAGAAAKHYDDTASAVADLNVGEDAHGIWLAGAIRAGATDDQVRALRASAPSGDWRPIGRGLELVAACQVNVPGFPIARTRIVASGEVTALVAAGAMDMMMRRYRAVDHDVVGRVEAVEHLASEIAANVEPLVAAAAESKKAALRARVGSDLLPSER
jgi:hypothetical protein